MRERLEKQAAFLLEVDKMKRICRQTHILGRERAENDAEHSWHLALMAFLLPEYANGQVDVCRVMKMVLVHDLVEIDAGDTYAYDEAANVSKRERELKAAERIFGLLPKDQARELWELWEEFEEYETPEAEFAHVLDNFQPLMLNHANGGGDWKDHGVRRSQIYKRNAKTGEGSREIWEYMAELIDRNIEAGNIAEG